MIRAQKYGSLFCGKKKAPAATYPQVQGFQKYEGNLSEKKGACGNVVSRSGLPKIWGPFFWKKKRLRQRSQPLGASRNSRGHFGGHFLNFVGGWGPRYATRVGVGCGLTIEGDQARRAA